MAAAKKTTSDPFFDRCVRALYAPLDIASLIFFRIVFGLVVIQLVFHFWRNDLIDVFFVAPDFHFKYPFFGWVGAPPGNGMYFVFVAMGIAGIFIVIGLLYRLAAAGFAILWTYTFLIDPTLYQNHYYLLCLMGLILAAMPLNRAFAVDALIFPSMRSRTAPAWCLYLIRFQISVPYIFGAVHKFNPEWLDGEPIRTMLWMRATWFPGWGHILYSDWVAYFFGYGGLLLDLLIVPAMLWRRTRVPAFLIAISFHLMNMFLWDIDVFPMFMIAATALFFSPSWPRQIVSRFQKSETDAEPEPSKPLAIRTPHRIVAALLIAYSTIQLAVPWRPYVLNPGHLLEQDDLLWFSWNMMLMVNNGNTQFIVHDRDSGETTEHDAREYLSVYQMMKLNPTPALIHQLALHIAELEAAPGRPNVSVRARSVLYMNSRPPRLLIDPDVDLAAVPLTLGAKPWVMPLRYAVAPDAPLVREYKVALWHHMNDGGFLPYDERAPSQAVEAEIERFDARFYAERGLTPD